MMSGRTYIMFDDVLRDKTLIPYCDKCVGVIEKGDMRVEQRRDIRHTHAFELMVKKFWWKRFWSTIYSGYRGRDLSAKMQKNSRIK